MTLTLPQTKFSESELKQELALSLYAACKVTLIQAADIAGVGFFEFQGLLKDRKIPQHYDIEDFEDDLCTLRELRELKKR
jgi:predicted HTH domain antitoxin